MPVANFLPLLLNLSHFRSELSSYLPFIHCLVRENPHHKRLRSRLILQAIDLFLHVITKSDQLDKIKMNEIIDNKLVRFRCFGLIRHFNFQIYPLAVLMHAFV